MDGERETLHRRWSQRAEAACRRMFGNKSQEKLVTLTWREDMAVSLGKELAAFLLKEHAARDSAVEPAEASTACCPKCGQPGAPAVAEGEKLPERAVRTRAGQIHMRRQRWWCAQCRIVLFSVGRSAAVGDRRLQPERVREGGSPGE